MASQIVPARRDIPIEQTWDTASVFPSDVAWEAEIAAVEAALPTLPAFQARLLDGATPSVLVECFAAVEDLLTRTNKVYVYAEMFYNVDTADQDALAKNDRAGGLFARAAAAIAFLDPSLLTLGFEILRRWMAEDPRLRIYAHYVDSLERQQAHIRSTEVEEVLAMTREPFGTANQTHTILADAELRFAPARTAGGEPLEIAQGTVDALLASPDREVRRTAWEHYADAHLALKNTMATCLSAAVKQDVFDARVRRYPSSLEAAVSANHIPSAVFHQLIATYKQHLPTWHRYWEVRRRALGLDVLHVYDAQAPLSAAQPVVPFAQAMEWIAQGMAPLGRDYVQAMRRGILEQRWVDIYPNKNKRAGAFSSGGPGTHPFILMNYTDDIFSLSTLAHELGHSLHSYYTWHTQPLIYSDYSIFVAEVASNFNQALVRAHLLETDADPEFQIAVIEEAMANFHRYFFIMPTLARFELEIHERVERGDPLTADAMIALMADLFREGFGDRVAIDEARLGSTWCQFPTHLYSNFYVYQYATGISAAHSLARGVLDGAPGAVDRYLAFLKAGSSAYPLDALAAAGVDLTSPEPVEQTFGVLSDLVDRLEALIDARP